MSSNKHSASKPPSAKQARLDGIFAVPTTASPDVSVSALVTPTPNDSPVIALPSEQIQYVARDSDSTTGKCSVYFL